MSVLEAKELILQSDDIVLTAHTNPDGDAVGSLYGLYLALKKIGKNPIVLLEDYAPRFHEVMPPTVLYKGETKDLKPELFISLDCGGSDRINEEHLVVFHNAKKTINIDHHISNDYFGDVNIVKVDMSSASEVVFDLIDELCDVDKTILTPIYAGIIFDSGGFKYSKTSSNTHKIAGICHDMGVPFTDIYSDVVSNHTMSEMAIFTRALSKIKCDYENKIIYTYITKKDMEELNSNKDELGGVVSYLLNTEGFLLSIFAYEKTDVTVKISMRSKKLDVNLVASCFGGGGHQMASGCTIDTDIENAINLVLEKAKEHIKDEKFV